jgi:putative ABC transport system permease protein
MELDKTAPTTSDYIAATFGDKAAVSKVNKYKLRAEMGLLNNNYIEPSFKPYTQLSGVEKVTKVYTEESPQIVVSADVKDADIKLMGINSKEFGEVAWFRPQLLEYHCYEYLNLLAEMPEGVLLSRSFQKNCNMKIGDHIILKIAKRYEIEAVIREFVDYWPAYNSKSDTQEDNYLVVANFGYIINNIPLQPYQVWLKKKPGVSSKEVYNDIINKKIEISSFKDADTLVTKMKNEPAMLGTNGSLTLGFILTMIICINGFLIYWVMSLKSRSLQFGIMRSMGIPSRNIIGMLTLEHIMTSGSAIFAGISVGELASRIYIPAFDLFYNIENQVLPFRVVMLRSDYIKINMIVAFMLIIALLMLWVITKNVKMTQALKLGED